MKKLYFPPDFLWGAATASYQIEGAFDKDGKGESIWDRFSHSPGRIFDGKNGDVACDHYHLYPQDVALMKELGLKAYRLSISWPRIFPDGKGEPNPAGIAFYQKLLRLLRDNGIKTAVTLYHWDLPQKLQELGGWLNRGIIGWYERYARYLFAQLDGLVDHWITLNEPFCSSFLGYGFGVHAPGIKDFSSALLASHHLLTAHGQAVRAFREMGTRGQIGITLDMNYFYPLTDCEADREAAELSFAVRNRWFADPVLKGCYPAEALDRYRGKIVLPDFSAADLEIISAPIDFLGLNYYSSLSAAFSAAEWPLGLKNDPVGEARTEMGWSINPDGLYDLLKRLHRDYKGINILITENGCAFYDHVDVHGRVEDVDRVDFLHRYLEAAHRALTDGVHLKGYFLWSLMDNFEWAWGYSKRFGLIRVDYDTQKRTIKRSGYWYRDVIANNGFETVLP